jgi:hypothetical protein
MVCPPEYSVPLAGWVIVAVGAWFEVTVRTASLLVAEPNGLVTMTLNRAPLSDAWADGSV